MVAEAKVTETDVLEGTHRTFSRKVELGIMIVAAATALIYLYTAWWGVLQPFRQRSILLLVCMGFAFLYYPLRKKSPWGRTFYVDCGLAALSAAILLYIMMNELRLINSLAMASPLDLTVAILFLALVLEATRRLMGWVMVILPVFFLVYAIFGPYLPGVLRHAGIDWDFLVAVSAFSTEGVFGLPLATASTVIVAFVIFSAFLRLSGADFFFIDLPYALFGWMRGGPAKLSVVASGLLGTVSGSAVANVVGTGTFTIPLMKRTGFRPVMAGAVEAMASTGGQIMPPVMGAAAFIMADFLNVTYWTVVVAAFVPAVLYYISLFAAVDFEAAKLGLKGVPRRELPSVRKALAGGWFLVIPLIALVYLLSESWLPGKAAFVTLVLVVVVSQFSKRTRMGPKKIFNALGLGVKDMLMVAVVCAAAGIMISVINATGISITLSHWLVDISQGNLLVLLLLTMVVSIILGMGLTTAACYIFLALLVAPALIQMGVTPIAAHMFIFYYGCLSCITPPVAIAAYAAGALAKASPIAVGFLAWRLALASFIVPFFFVYQPALILQGDPATIALAVVTAIIGITAFAAMLQGYLVGKASVVERVLFGAGGLLLMYPGQFTDMIGFAILAAGVTLHLILRRRRRLAVVPVAQVEPSDSSVGPS